MIYLAIINPEGQVIYSTIPEGVSLEKITSGETVYCEVFKQNRRQVKMVDNEFEFILMSYSQTITNKIFKHYVDALKLIVPILLKASREITEKELKKTRRLKHNTISYTSKIQQELFKLIPQDTVARGRDPRGQLKDIEGIISKNLVNSARAYLKILKNVNFMKAEFAAYDMLSKEKGAILLDFQSHSIYKVIHLYLSSFWLDFLEKEISIKIENCSETLIFDYNSVTVCFSHIFDNAVKYACPNSEIQISFRNETNYFTVIISMISLKIFPDELLQIFNEEYSGRLANELHINGTGIGMNIIQKLLRLNGAELQLDLNTSPNCNIIVAGYPYEKNEIKLVFEKGYVSKLI